MLFRDSHAFIENARIERRIDRERANRPRRTFERRNATAAKLFDEFADERIEGLIVRFELETFVRNTDEVENPLQPRVDRPPGRLRLRGAVH